MVIPNICLARKKYLGGRPKSLDGTRNRALLEFHLWKTSAWVLEWGFSTFPWLGFVGLDPCPLGPRLFIFCKPYHGFHFCLCGHSGSWYKHRGFQRTGQSCLQRTTSQTAETKAVGRPGGAECRFQSYSFKVALISRHTGEVCHLFMSKLMAWSQLEAR